MKTVWMAEPVWRLVSCACSRGATDGLRAEQVHPIAASATMVGVLSGVPDLICLLRVGAFAYTSHARGSSQHGVTSGLLLQQLRTGAQDLQAGVPLVDRRHQVPRRVRAVRAIEHLLNRHLVVFPLAAVAPVIQIG